MASINALALTVLEVLTLIVGILANFFIVITNLVSARRSRSLPSTDLIITSLAFSNLLLEYFKSFWLISYLFKLRCYLGQLAYNINICFLLFTCCTSFWFTAWLCIFYCIRIVDISKKCCIRLKEHLPRLVLPFLLGTVVASGVVSGPIHLYVRFPVPNNVTDFDDCERYFAQPINYTIYFACYTFLGRGVPLVLMAGASFAIVFSLCRHAMRMGNSSTSNSGNARSENQIRVTKIVTSLAFLYACCVLFVLIYSYQSIMNGSQLFLVTIFSFSIYTAGCPIILILGNTKLRKTMSNLCTLRCNSNNLNTE
ncbi:taste receptor type 2 member 1-like [Protopterus annectens]|uniref:taste receptor type 2 member 1-like n=1 Tax=Protopterus annectens TaxID=7888 RepID=UPI001CFBC16E|nr:taste receptor type 2 member 1-like [Protopterus annectens]